MMIEITMSSELVVGSVRLGYVNPSLSLLLAEGSAELEVVQCEVIAWVVCQAKGCWCCSGRSRRFVERG